MWKPKAIIFDLGGVIINLNYDATAQAFKNLGVKNFEDVYSKQNQQGLFDDFEKGIISSSTFRDELRKHISVKVSDAEIDSAWNAMLLDIPVYRITCLQNLAKQYPIFLLSNTNEIHIEAFTKILMDCYGEDIFDRTFNQVYYSSRMKMRKPDSKIFEFVLKQNHLLAEETLFVDDSEQHIKGAEKVGLQVYHLKQGEDITTSLSYLLT